MMLAKSRKPRRLNRKRCVRHKAKLAAKNRRRRNGLKRPHANRGRRLTPRF